jgi:eukaryotic-like serine/threonine-protein kinase
MTDLLADLQSRLGDLYRIERELGGGGMSRVFLAEETALGRRVVIKLFPPELAAVLSPDRFEREVRVAAALQHPHIVPLLASGRAGDLLYYTMPFVEGESLRSRLARRGELPIGEALRLLREVAGALAYAHRRGFVHRDIKPENILLSDGHAVVTDFGIAKALSEAVGGTALTATGLSLGTPAYMAPEQAAGDGQVDHRADLYALGALVYEMLAGHPPFHGLTPQALIAAHLARPVPPLGEVRPTVPPDLVAIVHRCLEKRPADRYQDAGELVAALDTVAPGDRTRATTAPGAPERPWPLAVVLGGFALAGAAVLGIAWTLRTLAGLPDWFFQAAVVLLVIGFPVVLLATLAHNRRISAPGRTPLPLPGPMRRLTLRNAAWGGTAAFSALGVLTVGYMGMRALGIGPVGSLVASGRLAERERVIIADFASHARDLSLGPALTLAFRVDFGQAKLVSPVEDDWVRRVLQRMQRPDSVQVDLELAREIAQREGIRIVVAGEIRPVGPSMLITAQLVSAESGEVLASVRETASDSTRILAAVDRVSKRLRERIGESLRSTRANAPLEQVTTKSLDALRKYSEALSAGARGDVDRQLALLEEAVAADSGFAMAWRTLGQRLYNEAREAVRAEEALTRAFQLRDNLTFRERRLAEGSYYSDVAADPERAVAALESLLLEHPDDAWALNNLGVMYNVRGDHAEAAEIYRRTTRLDPGDILPWQNLFSSQLEMGWLDSASATLAEIKAHLPPGSSRDELDVMLALARRDYAGAEQLIRDQLALYRTDPRARARLTHLLAGALTIRGKLAEAEQTLALSADLRAARGFIGEAVEERARRATPMAMYLGDRQRASAVLRESLRYAPVGETTWRDRAVGRLVMRAVEIGDRSLAEDLFRELERSPQAMPGRVRRFALDYIRGQVLTLRDETLPEAVTMLRRASGGLCQNCAHWWLAQAFDRANQSDSALVYYERWAGGTETSWLGPGLYTIGQPVSFFRMAELYEARGDRARAAEYYGRLANLWQEADPVLQPRVQEARRRVAQLVAEPRM